jgi:hypothetical protein
VEDGGDRAEYGLTGGQFFRFHGLEVHFRADGPLSHTEPIAIAVTVTRASRAPHDPD